MEIKDFSKILSREALQKIFPPERSNDFFEALFGDAKEGAYDIELSYAGCNDKELLLELLLHQRPGCCLACNLTQGLPQVFGRHPIINIEGIVQKVQELLGDTIYCGQWCLGSTEQRRTNMHVIPLIINTQAQ